MKTKLLKIVRFIAAILLVSWASGGMAALVSPVPIPSNEIVPFLIISPLMVASCIGVAYLIHKLIDG